MAGAPPRRSAARALRGGRRCAGRTAQRCHRLAVLDGREPAAAGSRLASAAAGVVGSRQPEKPRLRAKISSGEDKRSGGESLFGLDSIIDFDWRISIGDADLTEAEFAELVARGERLVRFKGKWVSLDPALLAQIKEPWREWTSRKACPSKTCFSSTC